MVFKRAVQNSDIIVIKILPIQQVNKELDGDRKAKPQMQLRLVMDDKAFLKKTWFNVWVQHVVISELYSTWRPEVK